jgi:hypothetical protein
MYREEEKRRKLAEEKDKLNQKPEPKVETKPKAPPRSVAPSVDIKK